MEKHLSITEVAEILSVSTKTVHRWIKAGKLKGVKPGRDWRIPVSEVKRLTGGEGG